MGRLASIKTFLWLAFVSVSIFATVPANTLDSYFLEYRGNISRNEEKIYLDNFAYYLDKNSDMLGYIAYFSSDKQSAHELKTRVARAVKYLTNKRKIGAERLIVIYGGSNEESKVVLQPSRKDVKPPF